MKKVVIVLVLAVIVAVGATAAVFLLNDGDDNEIEVPEFAEETGTVYGNSDGNYVIDKVDKEIAERIISGELEFSKFPLADANVDGVVDEKDVQMIQDFIDKKSMKVNVLERVDKSTGKPIIIPVQYPISEAVVLSGSNLAPLISALHVTPKIVGAAYNTLNDVRDYDIVKGFENGTIKQISVKGSPADLDIVSKLKPQVMLTELSGMYDLDTDENVKIYNEWGIDVLRMECRDPGQDLTTVAVFGILLDRSEQAQAYSDFTKSIEKEIKDKEGSKFGSTDVLISSLTSSLAGQGSGYTGMVENAGGVNVADWEKSTKKVEPGSTWIYDDKYKVNMMLLGASNYYNVGFSDSDIAKYDNLYNKHNAWTNGDVFMFSTSIPPIVRIAYMAEAMYPDVFGAGWADNVHQQFIDKFFSEDVNYKVPSNNFLIKIN